MDEKLKAARDALIEAHEPEDVFHDLATHEPASQRNKLNRLTGALSADLAKELERASQEEKAGLESALTRLNDFLKTALDKTDQGIYGFRLAGMPDYQVLDIPVATKLGKYSLRLLLSEGEIAQVYAGYAVEGPHRGKRVAVKVIADPADNSLLTQDAKVLRILHARGEGQAKHFPEVLDEFVTSDNRKGLVLEYFDGYDLITVKETFPAGLPLNHIAWPLARALSALGRAHYLKILHTNLDPSHIMINGQNHNICFLGWSHAVIGPTSKFSVFNEDYSPPEVRRGGRPLAPSDLYSLGKIFIELWGGNVKTDHLPAEIDEDLQSFIKYFTRKSQLQRAQDAWEMYHFFDKLRNTTLGERKYSALYLPLSGITRSQAVSESQSPIAGIQVESQSSIASVQTDPAAVAICGDCRGGVKYDAGKQYFVCANCHAEYVQRVGDQKMVPLSLLTEGICTCCDPRRPLVRDGVSEFKRCPVTFEEYADVLWKPVKIRELDYGLCNCCQPRQALILNQQGQVTCSREKENLYEKQGEVWVRKQPEQGLGSTLLDDIDRALSSGSADLLPNGLIVPSEERRRRRG